METEDMKTKFCKHCAAKIPEDAVICTVCGRQVEELRGAAQPSIIINNESNSVATNANTNVNMNVDAVPTGARFSRCKDKWIAVLLCLCFCVFGAHKFYEGRAGLGVLYLFTCGLFFYGVIVDFFVLLSKPNPYYV